MQVKNAIPVPQLKSSRFYISREDSANNNKMRKDFEAEAIDYLNTLLKPDWQNYIKFKWTDDFFCLSQSTYGGSNFKMSKIGKTFSIDDKKVAELNAYIERQINNRSELGKKRNRYETLNELCANLFESIEKGFIATIDYTSNEVELEIRRETTTLATCFIKTDGQITEPKLDNYQNNIFTLSEAQAFIERFKPTHDSLLRFASELKDKLPKEYFING